MHIHTVPLNGRSKIRSTRISLHSQSYSFIQYHSALSIFPIQMTPSIMQHTSVIHGAGGCTSSSSTTAALVPTSSSDADADLHSKLRLAEEMLRAQSRKSENLIAYFNAQLRRLTEQLHAERSTQAAAQTNMEPVVRALLRVESKLRLEQTTIRQKMCDKDAQLNRLHREIVVLRERHNDRLEGCDGRDDIRIDRVAQFCPACRKEFHLLRTKSVAVQASARYATADGGNGGGGQNATIRPGSASASTTTTATTTSTGKYAVCIAVCFDVGKVRWRSMSNNDLCWN